jgi:hypothetical protein
MKYLKLLLLATLFIPLTFSCSDDSKDDQQSVIGCDDPYAVNYNPNADQQGDDCFYTLVGDWTAYIYRYADGEDILALYEYIDLHLYDNETFFLEAILIDGTLIQSTGTAFFYNDSATLRLDPTPGVTNTTEEWVLSFLDGEYLHMYLLNDGNGNSHITEWIRY